MSDHKRDGDGETVTITFDERTAVDVIKSFGWVVGEDDEIWRRMRQPVLATDGEPITLQELAGVVADEDGEPTPLRDDFTSLAEYADKRRSD